MAITVDIDNYQVRTSASTGAEYIGFNVFFRFDANHGFQSCDWRLQGGLLFPPYKIVGRGKSFFTHTYVLTETAKTIHDQVCADLILAKKDDPSLPFLYLEDGWKSAVAGTANLRRMFPAVFAELEVEAAPKAQGKQRTLRKQGEAEAAPVTTVAPRSIPKPTKAPLTEVDEGEKMLAEATSFEFQLSPEMERKRLIMEESLRRPTRQ